ncbi:hypothetical protein S1361_03970 [Streptomyces cyanogenus]|uniref:Cytochrome P450 n=1 Tax=Streptomyces cyanogenus TaxID=80860 RepID=A0ABX7TIS6_STRCY|nr:hypothetical protein S1361_03970 [Streptomyces cyanogenus]
MATPPARTPHPPPEPCRWFPRADNARLLGQGAVAPMELPDGVEGVAVLGHEGPKEFLQHPEVAKSARHFTALREGRITEGGPLLTFALPGMTTADGADHRRLRSLAARAFTPAGWRNSGRVERS